MGRTAVLVVGVEPGLEWGSSINLVNHQAYRVVHGATLEVAVTAGGGGDAEDLTLQVILQEVRP